LKKLVISKKIIIAAILVVIIIAIPSTVYGYNNYNFNKLYNSGIALLDKGNFDEAITAFNSSLKYKPKLKEQIESKISLVKELKDSKAVFGSAVELVIGKKYLEAIEKFKTIKKTDDERYTIAQDKIKEAGNLYITDNINNAKADAINKNYDKAITFLNIVLEFEQGNKDAADLKDSYNKEIQKIKDEEARKKAEEEARQKAEEAKKKAAEVPTTSKPKTTSTSTAKTTPTSTPKTTSVIITQAHERDAIKKEFEKIGFVFSTDTTAMYNKNGIQVGLLDRGSSWQVSTRAWGEATEDIYRNCITVIWGKDIAWGNLIYLDYALDSPGSVFKSGNIQAFDQDGKLVMYIFPSN
jgi:tetratricopeptide (TPR) repeat protein